MWRGQCLMRLLFYASHDEPSNLIFWQLDDYDQPALSAKLKEYGAKFPGTNNDITEPAEFNLMFGTSIGPTGLLQG